MRRNPLLAGAALVLAIIALGGSVGYAISSASSHRSGDVMGGGPGLMMGTSGAGGKDAPVSSLAGARSQAQSFADRLGLRVDEVMQFERNYYAKLVDAKGNGATEVLIDPASGRVSLEYGPAMMWNTRYGMSNGRGMNAGGGHGSMMGNGRTGGMMGGGRTAGRMGSGRAGWMMGDGRSGGTMGSGRTGGMRGGATGSAGVGHPVSIAQARVLAQQWLDANEPGVAVETAGDRFPGYYTLETLRGGRIEGMMSVNAQTGAVWRHVWHGAFVAKG